MALKKVDRHLLWGIPNQGFQFNTDTSQSTAGLDIEARLFSKSEALVGTQGTKINGSETGAVAGTAITLTFDLTEVDSSNWYELRIMADYGQTTQVGLLPNPETADEILVYVRPVFIAT